MIRRASRQYPVQLGRPTIWWSGRVGGNPAPLPIGPAMRMRVLGFGQPVLFWPTSLRRGAPVIVPVVELFNPMEALAAWWATQPTIAALASDGRLWFDEAPESVDLPRMIATLDRVAPDAFTTAYSLIRATVTINAQARLSSSAQSMLNTLMPALALAPLSIHGQTAMHCLPDAHSFQVSADRGPRGQDCWTASLAFEIYYTSPL